MKKNQNSDKHFWRFVQNGGLIQPQISTIDDVLNIENLDPKMWTALACPVSGLEFSEETLTLLDSDKNGRVRIPEIISVINYIKKYFSNPRKNYIFSKRSLEISEISFIIEIRTYVCIIMLLLQEK